MIITTFIKTVEGEDKNTTLWPIFFVIIMVKLTITPTGTMMMTMVSQMMVKLTIPPTRTMKTPPS